MLPIFILAAICVAGASAQADNYCTFILQKDCSKDPTDRVCATNNRTYRNRCEYAKVYCSDKSIHLQSSGPCQNEATTAKPVTTTSTFAPMKTTPTVKTAPPVVTVPMVTVPVVTAAPTTPKPINGSVIALDIFCLDLNYINCPPGGERVCGSDGKYYVNMCEFDKERCFHRELHPRDSGCV